GRATMRGGVRVQLSDPAAHRAGRHRTPGWLRQARSDRTADRPRVRGPDRWRPAPVQPRWFPNARRAIREHGAREMSLIGRTYYRRLVYAAKRTRRADARGRHARGSAREWEPVHHLRSQPALLIGRGLPRTAPVALRAHGLPDAIGITPRS